MLIAVPNVSEGTDLDVVAAIGDAFTRAGATVLDVHSDADHDRSVFTLAAPARTLASALAAGTRQAADTIDIHARPGIHPHVGAADVVPVVFRTEDERGHAIAEALATAHDIGDQGIPVFLYGLLADGRTRADLRRGGIANLTQRITDSELAPDFGPPTPHPTAGATLVAARPILVAFNVELAPPATLDDAKRIAALIRDGGDEGLPGLKAIGLTLPARSDVAQVSMNLEDYTKTSLAGAITAIERHANIAEAEVIGLPPAAAFDGFPADLPCRNRRTLEDALAAAGLAG